MADARSFVASNATPAPLLLGTFSSLRHVRYTIFGPGTTRGSMRADGAEEPEGTKWGGGASLDIAVSADAVTLIIGVRVVSPSLIGDAPRHDKQNDRDRWRQESKIQHIVKESQLKKNTAVSSYHRVKGATKEEWRYRGR